MDFLRLILKNAGRNRRRTTLTLLSVAVSLFLLVSLKTLVRELEGNTMLTEQSARRLVTRHAVSLQLPLPVVHKEKIARLPEVEGVSEYQWFVGYYKEKKTQLVLFAVDPRVVGSDPEYQSSPEHMRAFRSDRQALLLPKKMIELLGWKVGQRIVFKGTVIPIELDLVVRGFYTGPAQTAPLIHYRYFNEVVRQQIPRRADMTTSFMLRVRRGDAVAETARAIDDMFRQTSAPTRTESEKDFLLGFTSMLGNLTALIGAISGAVIFTILLVTANTMAMTVRERVGEIAVLKTLGFRRHHVFTLVIGEASFIAFGGGVMGMIGALLFFRFIDIYQLTSGVIQHFVITPATLLSGCVVALALGIVSSVFPAWRAARMPIVSAMRE